MSEVTHGDKLNVIIPVEHQSAPKETEADKAVRAAAQEIDEGKWVPNTEAKTAVDDMNIALYAGPQAEAQRVAERGKFNRQVLNDFDHTRNSLAIGQHPRVIEALAKLEEEKRTARTPQEYLEKTAMLFEMNAANKAGEHWDGEARWQGKENEEMRRGLILKPIDFYARLMRVIGHGMQWDVRDYTVTMRKPDGSAELKRVPTVGSGRVLLGRNATRIGEEGAYRVPLLAAMRQSVDLSLSGRDSEEPVYLCSLQYPLATEWMVMRFDEFGVPTSAKHLGWRTALLTMIRLQVITPKEAEKAFPLGTGPASSWYREQLFDWQNYRPEEVH
jgi:hypothetical protein